MESAFGLGILIILVGAFTNSAFGLGLKFTRSWKWEHIWLLYSATAMLVDPLGPWLPHDPFFVYGSRSLSDFRRKSFVFNNSDFLA